MQPDFSRIVPFLLAALVMFAIYRRLRRSFGRQRLRPTLMTVRIVLLSVIGCALLPSTVRSAEFLAAQLVGLALGIAIGIWGTQRTRFLMQDGQLYYVPHTYTGVAVSLLFLGRLVYRGFQIYAGGHAAYDAAGAATAPGIAPAWMMLPPGTTLNPLTVGILCVLIGYYVYFYSWVLWKSKHLDSADIETAAAPAAGK